ncbi:MAG: flagellar FliJ family protein [Alphaproteobacteria bacterium]
MKSLPTLIRLRKHTLDEARRELTELQRAVDAINQARASLDRELATESATARDDIEASYRYGEYLVTVRERRSMFDQQESELAQRITLAEAGVREAFRDLKQFEIADAQRIESERAAETRKEQLSLDEVALSSFRRQENG